MSDTVDLDIDLDNLDYGDFDDINPDDLDIDNLERELGLVNDTPTKEETSTADDKTPTNTSEPSSNEQAKTTSQDANTVDTSSKTPSAAAKIPSSPKAATWTTTTTTTTSPSKAEDTTTTTTTSKPKASSSPIASPARHQHGTNGHQQQYNPRMNRGKPFMSGQHHHPPFNPGMMNIKYVLQSLSFLFISLPFLPLLHSPS